MARQNAPRSIEGESNLAQRIQNEREHRGWSYEALAKKLTDVGCSINSSAIYRIEKGAPPRRITVDELVALARVFETSPADLLTPVELLRKTRGKEIVEELDRATDALVKAIASLATGYGEYFDLCAYDPELREYIDNHRFMAGIAEDAVPAAMFSVALADGTKVEPDDERLRAALVEVHAALIEAASAVALQVVSKNQGRAGAES
jgi:transcriptional regulator with XRE-family HTH domain